MKQLLRMHFVQIALIDPPDNIAELNLYPEFFADGSCFARELNGFAVVRDFADEVGFQSGCAAHVQPIVHPNAKHGIRGIRFQTAHRRRRFRSRLHVYPHPTFLWRARRRVGGGGIDAVIIHKLTVSRPFDALIQNPIPGQIELAFACAVGIEEKPDIVRTFKAASQHQKLLAVGRVEDFLQSHEAVFVAVEEDFLVDEQPRLIFIEDGFVRLRETARCQQQ